MASTSRGSLIHNNVTGVLVFGDLCANNVERNPIFKGGTRPWDPDEIDARVVDEALCATGAIVDSEQQIGGYPHHAEIHAPFNPNDWGECVEPAE